jgi:hypothetical protein
MINENVLKIKEFKSICIENPSRGEAFFKLQGTPQYKSLKKPFELLLGQKSLLFLASRSLTKGSKAIYTEGSLKSGNKKEAEENSLLF